MNPNDKKIDGKKEAAMLLASLDSAHRDRILADIKKTDPVLAELLQKGIYRYEQIFALESTDLQKLLQSLPSKLVALSMRGLADDLKAMLKTKISNRQAQMLEDEIQALGPQKPSDIQQAKDKIAAHAGAMHEQKLIKLI